MELATLIDTLDGWLEPARFKDYSPNGLQVEGRREVGKILAGVTASQALIDAAIAGQADAILVHHGWFWKGEDARVTGIKKTRLASLLAHDISLIAYHLPLDAHPELGNNAQLARVLGLQPQGQGGEQGLLWHGAPDAPLALSELTARCASRLARLPLVIGDADRPVRRVAWCTGGAQGYFADAIALGVDAFITGEASEYCCHLARETGVGFISAGHHATERYGIAALAARLKDAHALDCAFLDLDNPI